MGAPWALRSHLRTAPGTSRTTTQAERAGFPSCWQRRGHACACRDDQERLTQAVHVLRRSRYRRRLSTREVPRVPESAPGSRTLSAMRSVCSLRATNAIACRDGRSIHCASSMVHTSGSSLLTSASKLSTARPRKKSSISPPRASERGGESIALGEQAVAWRDPSSARTSGAVPRTGDRAPPPRRPPGQPGIPMPTRRAAAASSCRALVPHAPPAPDPARPGRPGGGVRAPHGPLPAARGRFGRGARSGPSCPLVG